MMGFMCEERDGRQIRIVEEVPITAEFCHSLERKLRFLPERLRDISWTMNARSRVWTVDDVGILWQGGETFEGMPDVHYIFWDRRTRGRESMCQTMARVVACSAGSRGVFSAAPVDARVALAFARRIGFQLHSISNGMALLTLLLT